jgi:hypothetical protein
MFPLKLSVETICSDTAQVTAERCTGVPQGGPRPETQIRDPRAGVHSRHAAHRRRCEELPTRLTGCRRSCLQHTNLVG